MKKIVRFLRPAELEMLDAARYYELQAPGLGIDFLNKIDQAVIVFTGRGGRFTAGIIGKINEVQEHEGKKVYHHPSEGNSDHERIIHGEIE